MEESCCFCRSWNLFGSYCRVREQFNSQGQGWKRYRLCYGQPKTQSRRNSPSYRIQETPSQPPPSAFHVTNAFSQNSHFCSITVAKQPSESVELEPGTVVQVRVTAKRRFELAVAILGTAKYGRVHITEIADYDESDNSNPLSNIKIGDILDAKITGNAHGSCT
jgi:hypothetical protein